MIYVNFLCTAQHEIMGDFRLRRCVNDIFVLLGCYTALIVMTFRKNLSIPSSNLEEGCPETSLIIDAV